MQKHAITFFSNPKTEPSSKWLDRNLAFNREILLAFFNQRMIENYDELSVKSFKAFLKTRFLKDPTWPERVEQIFADTLRRKDFKKF